MLQSCRALVVACFVLISSVYCTTGHSSNWAVIVSASMGWMNYRHHANALTIYHHLKASGLSDSNIILMVQDDVSCASINCMSARVYDNLRGNRRNLLDSSTRVDYRGDEVTVANLLRVLTGRHPLDVDRSQRLLTDHNSNLLIYLTGHGGDQFLKFHDHELLTAQDLADSIQQMNLQKRYKNILLMSDTCQASTLHTRIRAPNVIAIGSSRLGQNSYAVYLPK